MKFTKAKFRKLKRDPKGFFKDLKIIRKFTGRKVSRRKSIEVTELIKPITGVNKQIINRFEPKVIGMINCKGSDLQMDVLSKSLQTNHYFTSLVLIQKPKTALVHDKKASVFLRDKQFIGFKDKRFYFLFYDEDCTVNAMSFFEEQYMRGYSFKGFRNLFVYSPYNNFPFLLRQTSPFMRLILILEENYDVNNECFRDYIKLCDVCIYHKTLEGCISKINFRRKIAYTSELSLEKIVKSVIVDNASKQDNLFLPILCDSVVNDIDCLNDKQIDVYLKLKTPLKFSGSFEENVEFMSQNIEMLLVKEESYLRYKSLLDSMKLLDFLLLSLGDGLRYEVQ